MGNFRSRPVIAAASTMRFCLDEIAGAFAGRSGGQVRLVFGSSGNLTRQIEQGAPFAMFLSADEDFATRIARAGHSLDDGAVYAVGRLALVARRGAPLKTDPKLLGLGEALRAGRVARFAIANPDHAPYGARARETLQHAGLWRVIGSRLVLGENVAQAAQFAASGAAQGGLISTALALSPRIAKQVNTAVVPAHWHQPLRQRMIVLQRGSQANQKLARGFFDFMQGRVARAILKRNGFGLP